MEIYIYFVFYLFFTTSFIPKTQQQAQTCNAYAYMYITLRSEIKISVPRLKDDRWMPEPIGADRSGIFIHMLHMRSWIIGPVLFGCCTKFKDSNTILELSRLRLHIFGLQIFKQCLCWLWNQKAKLAITARIRTNHDIICQHTRTILRSINNQLYIKKRAGLMVGLGAKKLKCWIYSIVWLAYKVIAIGFLIRK